MTKIINSKRNRLQEVRFLFKIASKSVSAKHLHCTEKHKMLQRVIEHLFIYWQILLKFIYIQLHQFFTQIWVKISFSLPQERCYIIVNRSFSSALEINEIWYFFTIFIFYDHHVTRLKIAIHKCSHIAVI